MLALLVLKRFYVRMQRHVFLCFSWNGRQRRYMFACIYIKCRRLLGSVEPALRRRFWGGASYGMDRTFFCSAGVSLATWWLVPGSCYHILRSTVYVGTFFCLFLPDSYPVLFVVCKLFQSQMNRGYSSVVVAIHGDVPFWPKSCFF